MCLQHCRKQQARVARNALFQIEAANNIALTLNTPLQRLYIHFNALFAVHRQEMKRFVTPVIEPDQFHSIDPYQSVLPQDFYVWRTERKPA